MGGESSSDPDLLRACVSECGGNFGRNVCAVAGLDSSWSGEGIGVEPDAQVPMLEPVLSYQVLFPDGEDVHLMLLKLRN